MHRTNKKDLWPDVLLYEHWPPRNTSLPPPSPSHSSSAPESSSQSARRSAANERLSSAEFEQLRTSVACIFRMHVEGDPAARHLYVTAVPPARRTNSHASTTSGWPLYVARRDESSSTPVVAVDVAAEGPASAFAARLSRLTAQRAREVVLLCAAGLPDLPDHVLRVEQDWRAGRGHNARARRRMPCALVGRRNGNGGYTWCVRVRPQLIDLRQLMLAAWIEELTTPRRARKLAGQSGYNYASMFCAIVSLVLRGERVTDREGLVRRAQGMAARFGIPWRWVLQSMSPVRRERRRLGQGVNKVQGDTDRFCAIRLGSR